MANNTVSQLKEFFSVEGNSVKTKEMMDFWKSLSDTDKVYYQTADLSTPSA